MASIPESQCVSKSINKFKRTLLATTCLTVASGATAVAGTISEGTAPAPSDFANTSNGYLLPVGATQVFGTVGGTGSEGGFDGSDWFEFQGLAPGNAFTLTGAFQQLGSEAGIFYDVFADSGTFLAEGSFETCCQEHGGNTVNGIVPTDGKLVLDVFRRAEFGNAGGYVVSLDAPVSSTPEPATAATVGLALAGALVWRRKRTS